MKNEEKTSFSSKYCDDLLVEVLENGRSIVQEMTKAVETSDGDGGTVYSVGEWEDNSDKLDSITRFADVILKAKKEDYPSSIAASCKFK